MFISVALFGATETFAAETAMCDGLITVSVASLRSAPAHSSELETQVLCGTPVKILGDSAGWLRVRVPDGYEAFAHPAHVALKTEREIDSWRTSPRVIVTSVHPQAIVADTLSSDVRNVVADATLCNILEGRKREGARYAEVWLPDGRRGFISADCVEDFTTWASREPQTAQILSTAFLLNGTPYLWGGVSPAGVDCSGLTQLAYLSAGILLPRNASSQALAGHEVDVDNYASLGPADLVFFAGIDTPRITHVALSLGGDSFIHSLGTVHLNSLNPASGDYLERRAVKAVRLLPDTPGATRLRHSPLYFNQ